MNIFLSSPCPKQCAIALDDKRVVKMAVETAQLLATALRLVGVEDIAYKATHTAHPCSLWAGRSRQNFLWLVEHGLELCEEYEFRYDRRRVHASKAAIIEAYAFRDRIVDGPLVLGSVDRGGFNSSGFDTGDVFPDYRLCLVNKWRYLDGFKTPRSRKPVWTYRGAPPFKRELWDANFNNPPRVGD
jgi:hypothetical protein